MKPNRNQDEGSQLGRSLIKGQHSGLCFSLCNKHRDISSPFSQAAVSLTASDYGCKMVTIDAEDASPFFSKAND